MLYPVELRALTTRRITLVDDRMQTFKIDRARYRVNPTERVVDGEDARVRKPKNKTPGIIPGATIWAVQDSNL
jgi:hypothetical protein